MSDPLSMKYVIHLAYDSDAANYYIGPKVHVRGKTPKLGKALVFESRWAAQAIADEISKIWFAGVTKVSERKLFEARLKGT